MKLSLRVTLTTTLLTMILLTVFALWLNSRRNARFTAEDLSTQILDQNSRLVDSQIEFLLETASRQGRLDSGLIRDSDFDNQAFTRLAHYWMEILKVHSRLSSESLGLEATGELSFVRRLPDGKLAIGERRRNPSTGLMEIKDYWPHEYPTKTISNEPGPNSLDPRTQPWYVEAKRAKHQVWSPVYVLNGVEGFGHMPGVSCSTPIYAEDGSLRGVLSSSFDVVTLCEYLQDLKVGKGGFAFVIEAPGDGNRRIVAHPDPTILIRDVSNDGRDDLKELVPPEDLVDHRVPAFLRRLPARIDMAASRQMTQLDFSHNGIPYLGAYRSLSIEDGPKWLICTVIPAQDVLARVDSSNRETLHITFGILAIALLVALLVSAQVALPLKRVVREATKIGRFEIAARPVAHSIILEIDHLANVVEETKTSLRSFGKYVPTKLIRQMISSGQEATLGGERRRMTVSFCDLANFTSLAEKIPPEELVRQMGDYFGRFSSDIASGGGTVDKYIGDAIMAFWGAPVPSTDHAIEACVVALRNQTSLAELHRLWRADGKPELVARIGIMTGEVVVGNIGSPARLNYTVMGDTVNLASRLEGLGKVYGTRILIGEPTYLEARDAVLARPVDWVSVKGTTEGMLVYELLALKGEPRPDLDDLSCLSERALGLYRQRSWADALDLFEEIDRAHPGDGPARVLADRCRIYLDNPPAEDWDGVYRMVTK